MRLTSITYQEWKGTPQEWTLERMSFGPRMLIVGRNTAGKSRSLAIISSLARYLVGIQPPALSGEYVAIFDQDGTEYRYELRVHEQEVLHERIVIGGAEFLSRSEGGAGTIVAEKIADGSTIEFQVPPSAFAAVARRDAIQHSFIEPLFEWASSLRFYQFAGMVQGALAFFTPLAPKVDDRDQNAVVGIFRDGVNRFGEPFIQSIKRDLADIDYKVDNIDLAPPISVRITAQAGAQPVSISIKEKELAGITDQLGMSTGMFRVVALLIHVNYAQFKGSASSVLVDDIGEGLDFDRSCRLIELLRAKAITYNFQLIMSSNDKFVMNHVPLDEWTVLQRSGNTVHVRNQENSKDAFDEFKFTGLSNFSFFEMNAIEMGGEGIGANDA